MKDKYIMGSLTSMPPIIIGTNENSWGVSPLESWDMNRYILRIMTSPKGHELYYNECKYYLILDEIDLNKEIPVKKVYTKNDLCMTILAKHRLIKNTMMHCNHNNGLKSLSRKTDLKLFVKYSNDLRDYQDKYSLYTLNNLLFKVNRVIAENNRCVAFCQFKTFNIILKMILRSDIDGIFIKKVKEILNNQDRSLKVFYRYIKSFDYYINLEELFKNV